MLMKETHKKKQHPFSPTRLTDRPILRQRYVPYRPTRWRILHLPRSRHLSTPRAEEEEDKVERALVRRRGTCLLRAADPLCRPARCLRPRLGLDPVPQALRLRNFTRLAECHGHIPPVPNLPEHHLVTRRVNKHRVFDAGMMEHVRTRG